MKRKLGFLMTLVIALCTSSAWAQSVVSVGTNLDFSEGTPVDNAICTYEKDMTTNNTTYCHMVAVPGWEFGVENSDARAAGLFAYGSGYWLGGAGYNVPATNPAGVAEGNALGVVAVWDAVVQYVQPVTLEAGTYAIYVPVYNSVGATTAPTKSLIGFIADNGTEYLAPAKAYATDVWTTEAITFTLTETTTGKLSLGYDAPNSGNGSQQHLFFDKVEILAVSEADLPSIAARAELDAAVAFAQSTVNAKANVGAGLFMYSEEAYNTYAAAVAAAKAVSENAEATADDLAAALAALNAATEAYAVTAPAADAIYAVKFNGTENYLTIGESNITIQAVADTLSFEAVGNGKYYIHDNVGKYLSYAGNNKWTMTASADVKDEWTVSVNADGLYTLTGKNGGIGVDGTEAGATCYGDKKDAAVALWTIAEIVIEDEPIVKTDYTDAIVNADLSTTDAWNTEGTKGISGGVVKVGSGSIFDFSQTITLPAGQYKMTAQAAYRYSGAEQSEYEAIVAGTETRLAKLYAETSSYKYEVAVQNRYDGASDTDYAAGAGSVTVNGKYVPNSSAAVQAWFNNGQYVNELVFNVQEDGQVKIGIAKTETPEVGDYANIGAWTLTRLGDAEADPKEEEPTPEVPEIIVWNINPADYPAGTQYAVDEAHVVNDTLTIYTTQMHWTTQLRVYSSSEHNGFFYSNKLPAAIKSIEFTAGNKKDVLVVYGSNDGATWTEAAKVTVPSTSYTSGLVADLTGTAYNYFKVDVEGNQQIRISNMVITLDTTVELPKVVAAPAFSLSGCNLFAPATVELTAEEGAAIYWSTNNVDFVEYTAALAIDSTCTVYAYAEIGNSKSVVASAEYVMAATYDNVTALLAAEATADGVPVVVKLTAVVDSLGYNKSGEVVSVFLIEGDDTLMVYDYNIPEGYLVKGNKVKGQLAGLWKDYKGTLELCNVDYSGATAAAPVTVESPWVGAAIENGVTYYLYNVKANAFMKGANAWGTQASFGEDAVAFTAEGSGNVYGLKSTYGSYLGTDLYVDQAKKEFVFDEVGEGIYTIAKDGAYVGYDGGNIVVTAAEINDGSYWQLLTKESIVADMVAADAATPYYVTALITCANFGRNDQSVSAWTGGPSLAGDDNNFCAEKWNAGISTVTQTLTGLPNGTYKLQAQGLYRMGGVDAAVALRDAGTEIYDVKFFANTDSVMVMSVMDEAGKLEGVGDTYGTYGTAPNNRNHASKFFNAGYYEHELFFTVTDGTAVIGVANNTGAGSDWLVFDNFRLTYYGTASVSEINKQYFYKVKAELDALTETYAVLYSLGAVNNAYMAVSDSAFAIANDENVSVEVIEAYIPVMEAKIAEVKAIDEYYNNVFTPMNDLCYETQQNSTPNSDEAYAAFDEVCALAGFMNLYTNVATIEDLEALVDTLEDARRIYVVNAVPAEGFAFDYTFLAVNPDMADGTINGWTATEGWQFQSNAVYTGEGAELNRFQERWQGGSGLGNTSTMQTLANMPNGVYRISADIMATAQYDADPKGHTTGAYWVANSDSVAVATENNKPEHFTVEATVVDGTLTIGLVGVNTTANWMGLDNVTIEYCGVPVEPFTDFYTNPSGEEALESLGNIELFFFDLVENVVVSEEVQATLTTPTYEASVWANCYVNEDNPENVFNYIYFELEETYTEPGEYVLNIPAGLFTVDGVPNAKTQVYFTVKAAGSGFEAEIRGVIPEAGEVTELSEIIVQFSNDQVMPYSNIFLTDEAGTQYEFELDINHPDYTQAKYVAKDGAITAAGTYTLDCSQIDHMNMMTGSLSHPFTGTYSWTIVASAGKKVVYDLDVERVAGLGYAAENYTIATSELAALLGVESLGEAAIWGVNPDGSYVADAMAAYDGWRAVDGTFAGWSSETAAVCVKLFAEEAGYLVSICTHGDNGNDPVAGTQSTAVWALVAGVDTVVINTNITFVEPTIINIADFEVVSTIIVAHNETAGVAFSGNTASFDAAAVAAALGVASIDEAEQYILNVTTGNLVVNSTDGWRNSQGDATAWGSLDEGSVCVKINVPASGSIDYIGCYDATYEAGETYTAKWAFVHEGKAVVIEVVITFVAPDGIENIEAAEDAVIYTITGKRVLGDVKSLEQGIYIVNGKKVLVK